jgi:hypothetical protein
MFLTSYTELKKKLKRLFFKTVFRINKKNNALRCKALKQCGMCIKGTFDEIWELIYVKGVTEES